MLRLTVSDSLLTSTDDMTVVVTPAPLTGLTGQYFNDPGTGAHFGTLDAHPHGRHRELQLDGQSRGPA